MSEARKHGLGRGLSALLGEAQRGLETDAPGGGVREIEVARIRPNPNQPRRLFDEQSLTELAESIVQHGMLQPILVRPAGPSTGLGTGPSAGLGTGEGYEIVAGERRWRAAQRARLHAIPALVKAFDDSTSAEVALIENVQRTDLNAIEEAEGYRALIQKFGHGQEQVGKLVGKSRSHVANLLRLLDLPDFVKQMLLRGDISMGHARAVATADDPAALASEIAAKGLSVRQAETLAKRIKPRAGRDVARAAAASSRPVDADLEALERQLGDMLGLKVKVVHKGSGGTVSLNYSSLDQLDMICQRLSGEPI